MRTLAWIGLGWFAATFCSAVSTRIPFAHVMPDMAVVVVVFLATRRDPITVVGAAVCLGYLTGRAALAPVGLHELALMVCGIGVYLAAGNLAGSGGVFFTLACGVAVAGYHLAVFGLILWQRGRAGFSSWATASLVPDALVTMVAAVICFPFMQWLEKRLVQDKREGLTWR